MNVKRFVSDLFLIALFVLGLICLTAISNLFNPELTDNKRIVTRDYVQFSIDVNASGEIVAIGLGAPLADMYGCDYLYPTNTDNTCGNVSKAAVQEILYNKNMSYYMVSDDLKHNY